MKFKQFVENVNKLLADKPETAEFEVVNSKDDEGNGFNIVYYEPSIGMYDEDEKEFEEEYEPNAICIN